MGEALLARVEIDRRDALAGLEQRDRDVQCRRGFSRAALFVAEHDHVRGLGSFLDRLDQHDASFDPAILELLPHFSQVCHSLTINPHGRINAALLGPSPVLRQSADKPPELWQTARPSRARFQRSAAPLRRSGRPANGSPWCQPWAPCTAAIWRWCRGAPPRPPRGGVDLRQSHPVRAARGFRQLSAPLRDRHRGAHRGQSRPGLGAVGRRDVPGRLCHPHRAARRRQSRAGGQVPPAFLRRRRHRGGQAVHASPARLRVVRRGRITSSSASSPRWRRISIWRSWSWA